MNKLLNILLDKYKMYYYQMNILVNHYLREFEKLNTYIRILYFIKTKIVKSYYKCYMIRLD